MSKVSFANFVNEVAYRAHTRQIFIVSMINDVQCLRNIILLYRPIDATSEYIDDIDRNGVNEVKRGRNKEDYIRKSNN